MKNRHHGVIGNILMDRCGHAFNDKILGIGGVFPERVEFMGAEDGLVFGYPYVEGFGGERDGDAVVQVAKREIGGIC